MENCKISNKKELRRHGFVSFWLWMCTVISGLATIVYFLLMFSSKGLWSATPEPVWLRLIWLLSSVLLLVGYILLLKWQQNGFIIIAIVQLITMAINLYLSGDSGINIITFSPIIGLAFLYFILRIKKGGVAYWDAMNIKQTVE